MKIVWFHCNLVVESHMVENPDKTIVETGHRGFTRVRSNLQEFFFLTLLNFYAMFVL